MKQLLITIAAVVLTTTAFADPIHDAAQQGNLAGVQAELDKGVDVDLKYESHSGRTPLHYAGTKEVTALLIAKGADVNANDAYGWTPLHSAAMNGHKEIAELLIAKGANVNAKSSGVTPLWTAADRNKIEIVELLIDNGADVNAKDKRYADTALHKAAYRGLNDMVELLIRSGADLNAKGVINVNKVNRFHATPLDHALANRKYQTADLLVKYGGRSGPEDIDYRFESINNTVNLLRHLIIGDDGGVAPDEPSIEKLQGVFVIRGKVGGKYEVQYHTGDNNWQVREAVTLQANRQLYIDSSSYDEKRFYRVKLVE